MDQEIQHRIKSIQQTIQISNAQKLIAVSNIGKARRMLRNSIPYHNRIRRAIAGVLTHCPTPDTRFLSMDYKARRPRALIVISATRGLAGGYCHNIVRMAKESLRDYPAQRLIVLGNDGRIELLAAGYPVDPAFDQPIEPPSLLTASLLAEALTELLRSNQIECCDVIYTRYESAVKLTPVESRLFPLHPDVFAHDKDVFGDVMFEPNPETVLKTLALKYLKGFLYGCLVHAWTCELSARMLAMDSAIRNGKDMLAKLSVAANRARQGAITQEITEIVAGASSMQ